MRTRIAVKADPMNVFAEIEGRIRKALEALKAEGKLPVDLPLDNVQTPEEPRDPKHGDMATNAALALAKAARMKPRDIADLLSARLATDPDVTKAEVAGPGFINLTFAPSFWHGVVRAILASGGDFGRSTLGRGERVDIEYVSANPTGPMHIGHCRGAVFGDALASLLQHAGYEVTREYYINDAGAQVDKLGQSAFLRYREALGETIGEIPAGLYPGDYLKPIGAALAKKFGGALKDTPEAERIAICRQAAIEANLAEIKDDLGQLGVRHDVFFSEASLTQGRDRIGEAIAKLKAKDLIIQGLLPRPKGHDEDEWEEREQTLFLSTAFGDDMDRALQKSDGTYTYFAGDVGYHHDKLERGFDHYVNVLGADHVGYIPRLKAVVTALSDGKADYATPVCQLVKVLRDGAPVTMSKRAGTFVALRDVVDEVGKDAVRFMMLTRKNDSPIDFDLKKVLEQSKDNPVFYVQYAHARCASALKRAQAEVPGLDMAAASTGTGDLGRLDDPGEIELIRHLAKMPRLVEAAAREREPHRVTYYLYDLASIFHQQWNRGNDLPHLRFIQPDDAALSLARATLVAATKQVISSGLAVLGVNAPEELR
jgi:arginyl-tRNA synthetase